MQHGYIAESDNDTLFILISTGYKYFFSITVTKGMTKCSIHTQLFQTDYLPDIVSFMTHSLDFRIRVTRCLFIISKIRKNQNGLIESSKIICFPSFIKLVKIS